MAGPMTREEIDAFLDSQPGWITLTTIGRDGYPHSVPIGYFRLGDDVYMGCRPNTQKTKNIERNPKVSLSLDSGKTMADIKGVLIQGDAEVYDAPADVLRVSREVARARGAPEAEWPSSPRQGAAYIRVQPQRYVSWDYGK